MDLTKYKIKHVAQERTLAAGEGITFEFDAKKWSDISDFYSQQLKQIYDSYFSVLGVSKFDKCKSRKSYADISIRNYHQKYNSDFSIDHNDLLAQNLSKSIADEIDRRMMETAFDLPKLYPDEFKLYPPDEL